MADDCQSTSTELKQISDDVKEASRILNELQAESEEEMRQRLRATVNAENSRRRLARAIYQARSQGIRDEPRVSAALEDAEQAIKVIESFNSTQVSLETLKACSQISEAKLSHIEKLLGAALLKEGMQDMERKVAKEKIQQGIKTVSGLKSMIEIAGIGCYEHVTKAISQAEQSVSSVAALATCHGVNSGQLLFEVGLALRKVELASSAITSQISLLEDTLGGGLFASTLNTTEDTAVKKDEEYSAFSRLTEQDTRFLHGLRSDTDKLNIQLGELRRGGSAQTNSPMASQKIQRFHLAKTSLSFESTEYPLPVSAGFAQPPLWMQEHCKATEKYLERTSNSFEALAANMHFLTQGMMDLSSRLNSSSLAHGNTEATEFDARICETRNTTEQELIREVQSKNQNSMQDQL